jgi:hypothetical protein
LWEDIKPEEVTDLSVTDTYKMQIMLEEEDEKEENEEYRFYCLCILLSPDNGISTQQPLKFLTPSPLQCGEGGSWHSHISPYLPGIHSSL